MDNSKLFNDIRSQIDLALIKDFNPQKSRLEEAVHYALSMPGKRLRPMLFLCALGLDNYDEYMDVACAIEYIHTYTLVHDDHPCMDNDDLRRGIPTVHVKFDPATALLTGDTLQTEAYQRISVSRIDDRIKIAIVKYLSSLTGLYGVAGGQDFDLSFNGEKESIAKIHKMKTADLISACILCAGAILNLDNSKMKYAETAGYSIGMAFQLSDDLLDQEGDEKLVGKKLKKDKINMSPNAVIHFGRDYVVSEIDRLYKEAVENIKKTSMGNNLVLDLFKKMAYREK